EAELRASRAQLARTGSLAGVGGWVLEPRGECLLLSEECRRILGAAAGPALPLAQAREFIQDEDWQALRSAIDAAASQQRPFDLLVRQCTDDRQPRWLRVTGETEAVPGRPPRVVGALQDVTALLLAQRRAEEGEHTLRSAMEAVDEAFALFGTDERLQFCNEHYRRLCGAAPGARLIGMRYEALLRQAMDQAGFVPDSGDPEVWAAQQIGFFREGFSDQRFRLGDGRWIRAVNRLTVDGLHVVFRVDVSESHRQIEAADAAARSKGEFLANMSHEIRTPLNAVLGMMQLLGHTRLDAEQAGLLAKADGAARHLLELLNGILDHAKAEAGKLALDPQPFDLARLLDELRTLLTANLADKPLALTIEADPRLPRWLLGDALRLQQVLINLGGNAIKFTAQGRVELHLRLLEAAGDALTVQFVVSDTGIGIAPAQQAEVFAAFSQAEASTTRRFGGTGLGLAISHKLVRLMGGELGLHSEPGRGSIFFFTLRLTAAQAPVRLMPPAAPPVPTVPRLAGLRLLLAEDNALNREVALKLLGREGARVDCAHDGLEALAALQHTDYDLVLMDMQMPRLDGLQATQQLRKNPHWTALPVLALTANASPADHEACLAAGMDGHIGKPFDADTLSATIRQLCRQAALDDAGALARLGGDSLFYRQLLRRFASQARTLIQRVHDGGDGDAAHQLKGMAAAIGARRLAAASAAVEAGRAGAQRLDAELETALQAAAAWLQAPTPGGEPLADALCSLADSLEQASLDCLERYDDLLDRYGAELGDALCPLRQAMDDFDTPAAAAACRALFTSLAAARRNR
ncbi:MAG TPA: ATP-binding protein, partial [Roseateles sp.]|uniref:hybrid sensor histidine kinase/response regulator n=1 Tax=Roseateles sp. TaxID=1971397 RepID=UPI002EDAEE2E